MVPSVCAKRCNSVSGSRSAFKPEDLRHAASPIGTRSTQAANTRVIHLIRPPLPRDRKSTRLNSSHRTISYAVFCLKKKKKRNKNRRYTTQNKSSTQRYIK